MAYVADLHIHSRFSRACSPQLNIPNLTEWAKYKGINVLGTGDFLHPLWLAELKNVLTEDGSGFLSYSKDPSVKFVLTVEIATMYSDKGKGRRLHNLVFLPDFASAETFQKSLLSRRANLASDGRPILGMSSKDLLSLALQASEKALFIPAHCILPSALVHTDEGVKEIKDIQVGQLVYTHKNRKRKVTEIIKHNHKGDLYNIQPWYFSPGLEATSEHPFLAFKTQYCTSTGDKCLPTRAHQKLCKKKLYKKYSPEWLPAQTLNQGDILVYPRFTNTTPYPKLALDKVLPYIANGEYVYTGGSRGYTFNKNISINEKFCRLVGYYLAEGWTSLASGEIGFAFNKKETDYIEEVTESIKEAFGIEHYRIYQRTESEGIELIISSKIIAELFSKLFYTKKPYRSTSKTIPDWMLHLPSKFQAQILRGWWRGDHGYTASRHLMNQMKVICLRLGIIPSIGIDKAENHLKRGNHVYKNRIITASTDLYSFSRLSFFEDEYSLLNDPAFAKCKRKLDRKHGWIDKDYIYLPIRKISTRKYEGEIFNLEVEEDNSYTTEFATVHNCWTPWFGIFGSESGYDSLEECFEDLTEYIYGIETGLSSDPAMNWRIKELDNKSIVSFSDAHSLPNLGRESTFINSDLSEGYLSLFDAFKNQKIAGTLEFYPEQGKYHYTGHRNCNIKYTPEDTKAKGTSCPVCKRGLTVGVMERVEELANRQNDELRIMNHEGIIKSQEFPNRAGYRMLVPLHQVIAEAFGTVPTSQKVILEYKKLVTVMGGEIKVLTKIPIDEIAKVSGPKIAEGVDKDRRGDLVIDPGYDGVYGVVKIWKDGEEGQKNEASAVPQLGLFD